MIDDVIIASYDCLRAVRRAEKFRDFPEVYDAFMIIAESRLDYLEQNAELMYRSLLPEYINVRDIPERFFKLDK